MSLQGSLRGSPSRARPLRAARRRAWLLSTLVLFGCAGLQARAPSTPAPDWYVEPPQEEGVAYGTGEGVTGREATENARLDLAGQVRARVTSEIRSIQERDGRYFRSIFSQDTEQEIADVALIGAKVVSQEKRGRFHYALMSIDRQAIARQQESEVAGDARRLGRLLDERREASFDSWWKLTQGRPVARRLAGNLTLLQVLGSEARSAERSLLARYHRLIERAGRYKALAILDETRIDGVREALAQQLEGEDVGVVSDRSGARIVLSSEYRSQTLSGETYVDATLWIRLRSARGGLLAELPVKVEVVSLSGAADGRRKAQKVLSRRLREVLAERSLIERLIEAA